MNINDELINDELINIIADNIINRLKQDCNISEDEEIEIIIKRKKKPIFQQIKELFKKKKGTN